MYTASSTAPAGEATAPGAPASRGEVAYTDLKRRLLLGEFPLVDRLGEERLAHLLEVSRTPVREALVRLHAEGLVERHPEGGFRPSPPDLRRTHELYEVRFALEYHALHLPAERGGAHDRAVLEALQEEWEQLATAPAELGIDTGAGLRDEQPVDPSFVLLDEEFHVHLAAAAGNEALVDALVGVNERIRPVRMHDFLTRERVDTTIEQHLGIVGALLEQNLALADERLRFHLGQSLDVVEERAAAALARMLGSRPAVDPRSAER